MKPLCSWTSCSFDAFCPIFLWRLLCKGSFRKSVDVRNRSALSISALDYAVRILQEVVTRQLMVTIALTCCFPAM
jgi:hypothetical protein